MMLGWSRNEWIFIEFINWLMSYTDFFLIFFNAQKKPVYLCLHAYTLPIAPLPSNYPTSKSYIDVSIIYSAIYRALRLDSFANLFCIWSPTESWFGKKLWFSKPWQFYWHMLWASILLERKLLSKVVFLVSSANGPRESLGLEKMTDWNTDLCFWKGRSDWSL